MAKKKPAKSRKKRRALPPKKVIEAQQKNDFRRRLARIVTASNAVDAFKLLPQKERDRIVLLRFRSIRLETAVDADIPASVIEAIRPVVLQILKEIDFSIVPNGPRVSLFDFFTAGLTLVYYLSILKANEFPQAQQIKTGFMALMKCTEEEKKPFRELNWVLSMLGWSISEIGATMYWFTDKHFSNNKFPPIFYLILYLHSHPALKMQVPLDGKNRPVYRVGWPYANHGMRWCTIKPKDLNLQGPFAEIPIDVYIQSHALLRLRERLDCIEPYVVHLNLFDSLKNIKSIVTPSGQTLVKYYLNSIKVGYLIIDIFQGVAVIRTFLFLTQAGTPEGDKIQQHIGLKMADRQFLAIDQMSTFLYSDLEQDDKLREFFTNLDCGELFKLKELNSSLKPYQQLAGRIKKFLGLESEKWDAEIG